jgi:hypothetical protein
MNGPSDPLSVQVQAKKIGKTEPTGRLFPIFFMELEGEFAGIFSRSQAPAWEWKLCPKLCLGNVL